MTRSQGRGIRRGHGAGLGPGRRVRGRGGKPPKSGCLVLVIALVAVPLFLATFGVGWVVG